MVCAEASDFGRYHGTLRIRSSGDGRQATVEDPHQDSADSETVQQIKQLLDTRVRPAVAMDGGDIVFQGFDDGIVTLQMRGACQGVRSTATWKMALVICCGTTSRK